MRAVRTALGSSREQEASARGRHNFLLSAATHSVRSANRDRDSLLADVMSTAGKASETPGRGKAQPIGPEPPTPGNALRTIFIEPSGWKESYFALKAGMQPSDLSRLLWGRRTLTAPVAGRVAKATGTRPATWMALQSAHDLWLSGQVVDFAHDVAPHLRELQQRRQAASEIGPRQPAIPHPRLASTAPPRQPP